MKYSKILVVTDNIFLYEKFKAIVKNQGVEGLFEYRYSKNNHNFKKIFEDNAEFRPIDITNEIVELCKFDLIISAHSKQLFPAELVKRIKCINIHPGLNPYNRGWFPQVFSILNKLPLGATIHEIDEQIDHGPIIDQIDVPIYSWDTSLTCYNRVLEAELTLIEKNLMKIINGTYLTRLPSEEGNLNLKKDFENLRRIDLEETGTFRDFLDRLRALTHGNYQNAFFVEENGQKVFVRIHMEPEEEKDNEDR
ncbi:MAG: hypothetical protein A2X99_05470 [Deltaproteobacteria bacterium GWB2_55_19]|nr:MAG: hypothetical protein A2X99_05470 [Deltaproteobacteria bacterium GWB2_55_19]HAO93571.1 hypothetical protein [Deltaproteobacteria bacterium]